MELKLLRNESNLVRIAASGRISQQWIASDDPLIAVYGDDIYQQHVLLGLACCGRCPRFLRGVVRQFC
jgi:hypothetical protein